ncbi:hypothetical protein FQA39_LY11694 [Lamprigera yunnana]|nr:hypothetical protein FQA39_LY11694 [Lamprigera yunnana]
MKLLLTVLYFHGFSCYLIIPMQENHAKKCVEDIIKNVVGTDGTLVYVYHNTSDDLLPDGIENPIVTVNADKELVSDQDYEVYDQLVFLSLKHKDFLFGYIKKMMSVESTSRRKYLLIYPLEEESNFEKVLSLFFKHYVIDVIVMVYDFYLRSGTVKVFTWDPYHPSNDCGNKFNVMEKNSCSAIKMVRSSGRFKSYNKCPVHNYNFDQSIVSKHNWGSFKFNFNFTAKFGK